MDINELESYRLQDAVKFNKTLNPRLWKNEQLRPEVKQKLLAIADDFREFLGIDQLEVKDITISGSNAAYTYTPHSDIDLHLVVDLANVCNNEVYRELFDAKKYQYNDQHNYKIGGYDVELYVQDSEQPHHSQGIYSLLNNDWVSVPSRKKPTIDDISVKSKYQDVGARIEQAIASDDLDLMDTMSKKIRNMRQAGLDTTGEFGPENLAFKVLRNNGTLDKLRQSKLAAKDRLMSLDEQNDNKKEFKFGKFGGMWFPGYDYYTHNSIDNNDVPMGGEDYVEEDTPLDIKEILQPFIKSCIKYLEIKKPPKIILKRDPEWTRRNGTFGHFDTATHSVTLSVSGRHVVDVLRTLAHELTHAQQSEIETMPVDAGETGSPYEDEANAMAGRIMRHWADNHPEFFKDVKLEQGEEVDEGWKDRAAGLAAAACIAGTPGCATTTGPSAMDALSAVQTVGRAAQTVKHMGRAGAEEELMQRFKNDLRRRQGQVVPEAVTNEAFDQPYKILRWEKGDFGDVDAIARLDDNTFLSIMFNKGFSQETKEEAWSVEFYRNNSQEVTGEGDAQRVFATVLSAIQTFIKKYKPNKVYFSASKEVEPGQNAQSRARLYDSLVQRYARAWGFTSSRSDTGSKVTYELSRIKPAVAESTGYIPVNDKEARDPRYSMAITQDIKPGEVQRQAAKMGFKTDAAGVPPLLMKLQNQLEEIKTGVRK